MTERQDQGSGFGAEARPAVEAARPQPEKRATAEIVALERDLERERDRTAKSLAEVQRRLDDAEADAAENATVTDARGGEEEQNRLQRETEERLDAELRRLQAESDAEIEAALAKVKAETQARMRAEAERRLAGQRAELRAEAEERIRVATETVRAETERGLHEEINALRAQLENERGLREERVQEAARRTEQAEARAAAAEQDRLDAEAGAKAAAADWLRTRTRALQREAEQNARSKAKLLRSGEPLDLNKATFEELRGLGMSLTQATRVIAYREREGPFSSPDDLARVPGISKKFLIGIKDQLTAGPL